MERIVLYLCGLWFWMTRRYHRSQYRQVARFLHSAKLYLSNDYNGWASTRDRGFLLPYHEEALSILESQQALARKMSTRFDSLSECVRVVTEELRKPTQAA